MIEMTLAIQNIAEQKQFKAEWCKIQTHNYRKHLVDVIAVKIG